MTFGKLALGALLLGSLIIAGCNSGDPTPTTAADTTKTVSGKGGEKASGGGVAGLNPSYKSTPEKDDARVGSALKGK